MSLPQANLPQSCYFVSKYFTNRHLHTTWVSNISFILPCQLKSVWWQHMIQDVLSNYDCPATAKNNNKIKLKAASFFPTSRKICSGTHNQGQCYLEQNQLIYPIHSFSFFFLILSSPTLGYGYTNCNVMGSQEDLSREPHFHRASVEFHLNNGHQKRQQTIR